MCGDEMRGYGNIKGYGGGSLLFFSNHVQKSKPSLKMVTRFSSGSQEE